MRLSLRDRSLAFALAWVLCFASMLGLVHRTLHAPGAARAAVASDVATPALAPRVSPVSTVSPVSPVSTVSIFRSEPAGTGRYSQGLAALFGQHAEADCRLYDQLAHGASAPCVPLVVLPVLLPAATFAFLEGQALARWVLLLRARGPPFMR